jgi:hypothetical protein
MSRSRRLKPHVMLTEESIRSLLCKKLQSTGGHILTIKTGRLCSEASRVDVLSMACRVMVRRYVMTVLRDAVIPELSKNNRIVMIVNKAREILGCGHAD